MDHIFRSWTKNFIDYRELFYRSRTFPSLLSCHSKGEAQIWQNGPSDLASRAILALLPHFQPQREAESFDNRAAHFRAKSIGITQRITISCVAAI
jgi:hypothetical protein